MTIARGFLITVISGVAFGTVGGLLGYGLGVLAPDYYRTVFRMPMGVEWNPVQAGLGLEVTQGLGAGLFIGLVIVVAVTWQHARLANRDSRCEKCGEPLRVD